MLDVRRRRSVIEPMSIINFRVFGGRAEGQKDFNHRGQVDLVDLQSTPDRNYKWLLHYQDHTTKFSFLRPLTSKRATEVALQLLKIFLEVGCPRILQSDNGRAFTATGIQELKNMWLTCKIVNGIPRHLASQGSVERSN
ncbi:SCAN domain-containing protein 3 [Trichonephila clavipes]|nr:SCAN domain-containing protein 3 [Trichonephila clavipes]